MFKLNIPVTKSYVDKNTNVLKIEGIATDTTIDRDSERFSETAVKGMHDSVNSWGIPIKVEHWDNIFSEIWVWKEADFTEDWKVFVKWEIDLDLSMGKDIQVLLNKWFEIALSVWWMVKDAISEFNADLWKSIKVYTDILLKEISIVKNPANFNTTLSLAKSFDIKEKKETLAGQSLNETMVKANSNYAKAVGEVEELIQSTITAKDSIFIKWVGEAKKSDYAEDSYYESYSMSELKYLDYKIIGNIYRIYSVIGADEIKEPEGLDWESTMDLPDYSFLPLNSDGRLVPYMDKNLKLRKDWIIYSMYRLAKGEYSRISAEDRHYAMEFLYSAYKQLLSTEKSVSVEDDSVRAITNDEVNLMKNCIKYKVDKGVRPQYEGDDLSDAEINKLAKAYSVLIDRNILKTNSNKTMNEAELKILIAKYTADLEKLEVSKSEETPVEEAPVEEAPVVKTEEAPVEETPVEEVPVVETEETPVEEVPVVKTEEAPVEEAPVEEDVVVEDTPVVEDTNTDTTEKNTSIDKALLEAITSAVEVANKSTADSIIALEKSIDQKIEAVKTSNTEAMTKSVNNSKEQSNEAMTKMATVLAGLTEKVEIIGKSKGDRKSYATSIAKGYTDKSADKSTEDLINAEMDTNGWDYATARTTVLGAE